MPTRSGSTNELGELAEHDHAKVLVLYTGGTIGMAATPDGYAPLKGFLPSHLRGLNQFHDEESASKFGLAEEWLLMPKSFVGKRIMYKISEYDPLLDSCNMSHKHYNRLAKDIKDNYKNYDAFVILHGTDTMAYTASALSYMLESLGKSVVLTGSQVPMSETRNDGRENFHGALTIAGHYIIPEVLLFFDQKGFRGNRTTKFNAVEFDAFRCCNTQPLIKLGVQIRVDWDSVFRSPEAKKFDIFTGMSPNVGVLRLFPGITTATVKQFLGGEMQGVVLQTYGAGNAPDTRTDLMGIIKDATDRGVLIVNCTQCSIGYVESLYKAGTVLAEAGVVAGADMTVEAALAKLSYVLGKTDWSYARKKEVLTTNIRGELTAYKEHTFKFSDNTFITAIATALSTSSSDETKAIKRTIFPVLANGAADNGDLETLEALKNNGVNMSAADYDGRTPLHLAAGNGNEKVVKKLLGWGGGIHAIDRFGNNPLMEAIKGRHEAVADLLIATGAELRIQPKKLAPILCNAAMEGDVVFLKLLRKAGADLFVGDYDKRTALHVACSTGQFEVVKFLVGEAKKQGSLEPLSMNDVFGNSPLSDVYRSGAEDSKKIGDFLEAAGAKLSMSELQAVKIMHSADGVDKKLDFRDTISRSSRKLTGDELPGGGKS